MSTGRQVTYTLKLNSNVSAILNQADKDAMKFDSSMWQLQKSMAAFGIGLGANFLIDAAKHWTQGAADYESAMLRIKNAADGAVHGIRNQFFINKEVDDFKLKLQEAVDAYGSFLFKIKNAGIGQDVTRRMYDNILTISKVANLPQGEIDATVRNIGIMLGEGILEARHLRQLSYVHPQIVPFLADQLGLKSNQKDAFDKIINGNEDDKTASQKLSLLISGGKLTKMAIPADVIIGALEKYRESVQSKLPETLGTVQSELNDLSNTFERLKNSLVLDNKPELVDFFHSLSGSIHWLVDHEDGIIKMADGIANIVKFYVEWRLALLALQTPFGIVGFFINEQSRLNEVLSLYSSKTAEVAISNSKLATSDEMISSIVTSEIVAIEGKTNSLHQQQIALNELSASLAENSIQMDLFTESQLANSATTEERRIAAFRGWNMYSYGSGSYGIHNIGVPGNEEQILNNELRQASLFTSSELEMSAAVKTTSDALMLENEQLALRNKMLAEGAVYSSTNLGIGLAGASLGTMGLGSKIMSGLSSLIQPVFIAGMSIEVADMLLPGNRVSKESIEMSDWLETVKNLLSFNQLGGEGVIGKSGRLGAESGQNDLFQKLLDSTAESYMDENGNFVLKKYSSNGTGLYNLLVNFQKGINNQGLDYNLLGLIDKADNFGNVKTSNSELYQLILNAGFKFPTTLGGEDSTFPFPYISREAADIAKNKSSNYNADAFGKDSHRLRGNSSNYFTTHIAEMNGVKTYTVQTDANGIAMSDKRVADIAGDTFVKMLTDAVNDAKLLSDKHK